MIDTAWALPDAPGALRPAEIFALTASDGVELRAALWPADGGISGRRAGRGLALALPGRAEFLEKVAVGIGPLVERGFTVASLDWRGQGRSQRLTRRRTKGHVGRFEDYVLDVRALLAAPELASAGPLRLVLGHSMGGLIAVLAAKDNSLRAPLLLSAPMFGIEVAPNARRFAAGLAWAAGLLGQSELWPPVPNAALPYQLSTGFEDNLLTGDRPVWSWMEAVLSANPDLGVGFPTLGWLRAAERAMRQVSQMGPLGLPGLAFYGSDERVISLEALAAVCGRLQVDVVRLEGARHEPLIDLPEHRAASWAAADGFFETVGI